MTYATYEVREAESLEGKTKTTELSVQVEGSEPRLLARVRSDSALRTAIHVAWSLPSEQADSAELRLTALEAMYAMVLRSDPAKPYHISADGAPKLRFRGDQESALRQLARWRSCAVKEVPDRSGDIKSTDWESVVIQLITAGKTSKLIVAAQVRRSNGQPVSGASVAISRGDHLACEGTTDSRGVATCKLFDTHGHHHHDEHEDQHAIVSFGGKWMDGRLLLPTTHKASVKRN